jgi:hypothetical protein
MFDFPGGGGQSFVAGLAIQQSDGKIIAVGHPNGATGIGGRSHHDHWCP